MAITVAGNLSYQLQSVHRDPSNQFPLIVVYQRSFSTDSSQTLITINLAGADVQGIAAVANDPARNPLTNFVHAIDTYLVAQGILTGTVS